MHTPCTACSQQSRHECDWYGGEQLFAGQPSIMLLLKDVNRRIPKIPFNLVFRLEDAKFDQKENKGDDKMVFALKEDCRECWKSGGRWNCDREWPCWRCRAKKIACEWRVTREVWGHWRRCTM
ncbi:hypothetical protein P154DRAFT_526126 [Amniculicola lignicola CBS 123094]|uniref:Zn(2)-C6 fungal-type domain-containing protein n=1 Tax=Amniculicola lignicola CBS 123094 TaxID=1392246 RepID=A0A6A5W1B0_9PLEO|nr:hypothetical protein P154DRAFT_526126 [Amniculicola lignicola CBS 123094]